MEASEKVALGSTWYRARFEKIEPIVVTRSTSESVWPVGLNSREKRVTDWYGYFPTWEEAHAWLLSNAERKLQTARLRLQYAQGEHGNVVGMKKPESA